MTNIHRGQAGRRRGMVLILVLVAVVLMALAAYAFSDMMLAEREAVELSGRRVQAQAQVESGVDYVRYFLAQEEQALRDAGGVYENPDALRGILVRDNDEPAFRGRFTLLATSLDDDGAVTPPRYGLGDESARLNLNVLTLVEDQLQGGGRQLLMALPAMTEDVADAILDWVDADDEPREFGCERDFYAQLEPAYAPRNGQLETVEELLLVRGVTPELLFGLDMNRNGLVDLHEQGGAALPEDERGGLELGWSAYLTLHSLEANVARDGQPRVFLNGTDMQQLSDELTAAQLPPDWVTFIVAYKQNGAYTGSETAIPAATAGGIALDLTKTGRYNLASVLDLVGAKVQVRPPGEDEPIVLDSPFPEGPVAAAIFLPLLMDRVTVNPSPYIPGRININQAPRALLLGVPGMNEEFVNEILSRRIAAPDPDERPNRVFETWIYAEGIVTLEEMKTMLPFLCGGGDVYRGQFIGYFEGGGPAARAEVVLDATYPLPKILFWRDVSHLGRGYPLETLGIEAPAETF